MKVPGIYLITNVQSGKQYVGQSKNIDARWKTHQRELRNNRHANIHLQNAWNKYGPSTFEFKILEKLELSKNLLIDREQYWIDTLKPEYNICKFAGTCLGRKVAEETKSILKLKQNQYYSQFDSQKLNQYTLIKDMPNEEPWLAIKQLYELFDRGFEEFELVALGSIFNAALTMKMKRFVFSGSLLQELINNDPNLKQSGPYSKMLSGAMSFKSENKGALVRKIMARIIYNDEFFKCIEKPISSTQGLRGRPGVYEISHPSVTIYFDETEAA